MKDIIFAAAWFVIGFSSSYIYLRFKYIDELIELCKSSTEGWGESLKLNTRLALKLRSYQEKELGVKSPIQI